MSVISSTLIEREPLNLESEPLPEKLSDCLVLALQDLELCEADPSYKINIDLWHCPNTYGMCEICLAGSVMAQTLRASQFDYRIPKDYYKPIRQRLYAIDRLRAGDTWTALSDMDLGCPSNMPPYVSVTSYSRDPSAFKSDMRKIVDLLREHGL